MQQTTTRQLMAAVAVTSVVAAGAGMAVADDPVIGDERALPMHLDQAAILRGDISLTELLAHGRLVFTARFNMLDGAGRPTATAADVPTSRPAAEWPEAIRTSGPDANACSGCHIQPEIGGAGDFVANVFVAPQDLEYGFDSVSAELSMERSTTALHGDGVLELLAREMTAELQAQRAAAVAEARATGQEVKAELSAKGVSFGSLIAFPNGFIDVTGIQGIHHDLIVKPFGQKAVIISLRQFSNNAFNLHHGMQAMERFGERWTGDADFDGDGRGAELTEGDITAAAIFQAALPPPVQVLPADPLLAGAVEHGEALFAEIGCVSCHVPTLILDSAVFTEPGPYNPAGTLRAQDGDAVLSVDLAARFGDRLEQLPDGRYAVHAFTDLKRHRIADTVDSYYANEQLTQNFVPRELFRTAPLWGVGSTAPYGHRGDVSTLTEAIMYHGAEAREARDRFAALPDADRAAIIEFLKSLQIPAPPLADQRAELTP